MYTFMYNGLPVLLLTTHTKTLEQPTAAFCDTWRAVTSLLCVASLRMVKKKSQTANNRERRETLSFFTLAKFIFY